MYLSSSRKVLALFIRFTSLDTINYYSRYTIQKFTSDNHSLQHLLFLALQYSSWTEIKALQLFLNLLQPVHHHLDSEFQVMGEKKYIARKQWKRNDYSKQAIWRVGGRGN